MSFDDLGITFLTDEDPGESLDDLGINFIVSETDEEKPKEIKQESSLLNRLFNPLSGSEFIPTQIGLGALKRFTYPADIAKGVGQYESLTDMFDYLQTLKEENPNISDEELDQIAKNYLQEIKTGKSFIPTQSDIENLIEEKTGISLQPKDRLQRGARYLGEIGSLTPGSFASKAGKAIGTEILAESLTPLVGEETARTIATIPSAIRYAESQIFKDQKAPKVSPQQLELQQAQGLFGKPAGAGKPPSTPLSTRTSQDVTPILNYLQGEEIKLQTPPSPPIERATEKLFPPKEERGTLEGRQIRQQETTTMGLRPAPLPAQPTLADNIGNIFSPLRFYNSTEGGQALVNEIRTLDNQAYQLVNSLYDRSREFNAEVNEISPQLVNDIVNYRDQIAAIPSPSTPQRTALASANQVLNRLATFDNEGNVTGYQPINNQDLINQIQAWNSQIDFDFEHGDVKNIYLPMIGATERAVIRNAEQAGNIDAIESFNDARTGYAFWAQRFNNPYIRPFRDTSNEDYSKLFKGALDIDEYNYLNNILHQSDRGDQLSHALSRELVEKRLKKYIDDPSKALGPEFEKEIREIESFATPEQVHQINNLLSQSRRGPEFKAVQLKRPPSPIETKVSKYLDKEWEDIYKLTNTTAGRKQLKKDLSKLPEYYDLIMRNKIRDILHEGEIRKDFTGNDIYRILNKTENYELFSDYLGEDVVKEAKEIAKERGDNLVLKQGKLEFKRKLGKKVISHALSNVLIKTLFSLAI